MEELLLKINKILKEISNNFLKNKISKNLFLDQNENLRSFKSAYDDLTTIINELDKNDLQDKNIVEEKLVYLLMNFSTIISCLDQFDDFIRLILQKIPDKET